MTSADASDDTLLRNFTCQQRSYIIQNLYPILSKTLVHFIAEANLQNQLNTVSTTKDIEVLGIGKFINNNINRPQSIDVASPKLKKQSTQKKSPRLLIKLEDNRQQQKQASTKSL